MLRSAVVSVCSLATLTFAVGAASLAGGCTMSSTEGADEALGRAATPSGVFVLTNKNNVARTGHNANERKLKVSNVSPQSFGKLYARQLDGAVFAQPLYVGGVDGKNVVYVATEHNSIYAFDADDTKPDAAPLWQTNLGPSLPAQDTGCQLLTPELGITSTPVIDPESRTIWVTTRNKENGRASFKLHALDIATGAPRTGSPTVIQAQAPGTGTTSQGGIIKLDPIKNMQRPGLLRANGKIYIGFASNCDIRDYHGWVLAYDAKTLQQTAAHITTPNGGEGGIWQGGNGLVADETGDILYTAGDAYDTSGRVPFNGANSFADSTVRLHDTGSALEVKSFFTPQDAPTWSPRDLSIGSNGGILLPGTSLFVAGDKRGIIYVVDKDNMGGGAVAGDAQLVQKFQGAERGIWGGSAYLKQGPGGIYYVWGNGDRLKAYSFDGQKFRAPARVNPDTLIGYPGGQLSLSSDGETPGTAILWTIRSKRTNPGLAISAGAGVVQAWDANDITRMLWTSEGRTDDMVGNAAKFAPPTIADGRVFVGTASNQLVAYGLFDAPQPTDTDAGPGPGPQPEVDAGVVVPTGPARTWTQIYTEQLGPGTPGHCSGTGGCHTNERGGFKCGTDKDTCYAGLVAARLVTPGDPARSPLGIDGVSPLSWLNGGSMPLDNQEPNPAGAAAIKSWIAAGGKND